MAFISSFRRTVPFTRESRSGNSLAEGRKERSIPAKWLVMCGSKSKKGPHRETGATERCWSPNRVWLLEPATSRFRGNHLARVGRLVRAEALSLDATAKLSALGDEINALREREPRTFRADHRPQSPSSKDGKAVRQKAVPRTARGPRRRRARHRPQIAFRRLPLEPANP